MSRRNMLFLLAGSAVFVGSLCAWQREFREYPGYEYSDFALPADYKVPSEWVFARLMYPSAPTARFVRGDRRNWASGNTSWTQDYPRADRHFLRYPERYSHLAISIGVNYVVYALTH